MCYSEMDQLTKATDGNSQSTVYKYSSTKGYLSKVTKPNAQFTELERDEYARLTRWRQFLKDGDPGCFDLWSHERRFAYDGHSWTTKMSDYYESGHYETGKWTDHVQLTRATVNSYDAGGLVTKIDYPSTADASFAYNAGGAVTKVWDSANSLTYDYDFGGRLTNVTTIYDTNVLTKTIAYAYDAASRRMTTTDGEGTDIAYSYSPASFLTRVGEGANARGVYANDLGGEAHGSDAGQRFVRGVPL